MRSKLLLATSTALLGLALGWQLGRRPAGDSPGPTAPASPRAGLDAAPRTGPEATLPRAPEPRPVGERTYVPLSEVYSTGFQTELAGLPPVEEKHYPVLAEIKARASGFGTSNAFVIAADNNRELVYYTRGVLASAYPPEVVWRRRVPPGTPLSLWLVVVFGGTSSTPPGWKVESVVARGDAVRFSFRRADPLIATGDVHPYVYWCKLPDARFDSYQLELFDLDADRVMLSRWQPIRRPPAAPLTVDDDK